MTDPVTPDETPEEAPEQDDESKAVLHEIYTMEHEVAVAESAHVVAKEAAKAAKDHFDAAVDRLRRMIRDAEKGPGPLFTQPKEEDGEAWRNQILGELDEPEIPPGILSILDDNGILSLGALVDFQSAHGDFWVKELKGLGAAKAAKISDAADAYWVRNPRPEPDEEPVDDAGEEIDPDPAGR